MHINETNEEIAYMAGYFNGNNFLLNSETNVAGSGVSGIILKLNLDNHSTESFVVSSSSEYSITYQSIETFEYNSELIVAAGGRIIDSGAESSFIDIFDNQGNLLNHVPILSGSGLNRVYDLHYSSANNILIAGGAANSHGIISSIDWQNGVILDNELISEPDAIFNIIDHERASGLITTSAPSGIVYSYSILPDGAVNITANTSNNYAIFDSYYSDESRFYVGSSESSSAVILNSDLSLNRVAFTGSKYTRAYASDAKNGIIGIAGTGDSYRPYLQVFSDSSNIINRIKTPGGLYHDLAISRNNEIIGVGRSTFNSTNTSFVEVFEITGITRNSLIVEATGSNTYIFNNSPQAPSSYSFPSLTENDPVPRGSATWSYVGRSGTSYGPSAEPPTYAGDYEAVVSMTSDNNYTSTTSSPFNFSINNNISLPELHLTKGGNFIVPISLNSEGNITGISGSIHFDPDIIQNPSFSKTDESLGATLVFNDINASIGEITFGIAFIDSSTFTSGSIEVLNFEFDINPNTVATATDVEINSTPVLFEVSTSANEGIPLPDKSITITINNPPVGNGDTESTDEDTASAFDVLANDTDVDSDPLTVSITNAPTSGSAVVQTDQTVLYTPNANFHGSDLFTYTINDGLVDSNEVTVSITVNSVDDPASLQPTEFSVDEDTTLVATVTATDVDGLTNGIVYSISSQPNHGSVSIHATSGEFTYIPESNYFGIDSFAVQVTDDDGYTADHNITIDVLPVPDNPTVVDDSFGTNEHQKLIIPFADLIDDDFDVDEEVVVVKAESSDSTSAQITPIIVKNGDSFEYDPTQVQSIRDLKQGETLTDTFSYTIEDPTGRTDSGIVTIVVSGFNQSPVADADTESTNEDVPAAFDVLANDTDVDSDPLTVSITNAPTSGSAEVQTDQTVLYTPNANFHGPDSFTYTVNDGLVDSNETTVSITVNSVDDPARLEPTEFSVNEDTTLVDTVTATDVDGLANGSVYSISSQPNHGSVSINATSGEFTYIPESNYFGIDSFAVQVTDDDGYTADHNITIDVLPVPDNPTVVDDSFGTNEHQKLIIPFADLIDDDFDVDEEVVVVKAESSDSTSAQITPIIVKNGDSFEYDPTQVQSIIELEPGEILTDAFSYTIEDTTGGTDSGTVTVIVTGVGYEGDLTGLEFNGVNYEDNALDVTDFVKAGRFLVQLDTLGDSDRLFSSADTWPKDSGGDGVISLLDWIQTGRYVVGLDSLTDKNGPTTRTFSGSPAQPASEDSLTVTPDFSNLNADSDGSVSIRISGNNFEAGKTGIVTLGVVSSGNASSFGTTLEFDPELMSYVSSSLVDSRASSLTYIINDMRADQGLLGILIASNPGDSLPPGFNEVLEIEFDISVDHHSGPLEILLSDKILRSVVSNRNAQKLDYTSENITANVRSITKFDQWAAIHESRSQNENGETLVLTEWEDTDGDGLSNAVEFILGTNPMEENNVPLKTSVKEVDGKTLFEATTQIIIERGEIEVEIAPLNNELEETGTTGNGTSQAEIIFGREKRTFHFPANQQSGFFIIRVKNKNS